MATSSDDASQESPEPFAELDHTLALLAVRLEKMSKLVERVAELEGRVETLRAALEGQRAENTELTGRFVAWQRAVDAATNDGLADLSAIEGQIDWLGDVLHEAKEAMPAESDEPMAGALASEGPMQQLNWEDPVGPARPEGDSSSGLLTEQLENDRLRLQRWLDTVGAIDRP